MVFGELTLVERHAKRGRWVVRCSCGTVKDVLAQNVVRGCTRTCGNLEVHRTGRFRSGTVEYTAMHHRLYVDRGQASSHRCIDCDNEATDWSYRGGDPDELASTEAANEGRVYSLDPSYYDPRCRSCHKIYDYALEA
ncbi:hypothetical protein SEA_DATTRAN_68 [Streptomyces phage Dattran]|nr:hypothetical protein SEA_DATTRAN_68 [Streptomyces phage Dattran]